MLQVLVDPAAPESRGAPRARVKFRDFDPVFRLMTEPSRSLDTVFRPDITVAVVLVRDGKLLLVEERVRGALVLNQPAGHLEPGESLIDAARRETLEESGWEVRLSHFIATYRWTAPDGSAFLRFAFAAEPMRHHPERPLDVGIERTLWLAPAELREASPRLRSPLVLAAVDDWLAGARLPLSAIRDVQ